MTIDHMVTAAPTGSDYPVQPQEGSPVVGSMAPVVAASGAETKAMPASYQMAAPLRDAELTALLMASPLYQKMEQIKKSINSGAVKFGRKAGPGKGIILIARNSRWNLFVVFSSFSKLSRDIVSTLHELCMNEYNGYVVTR